MDLIDYDYETEKRAHPENFEQFSIEDESVESELFCPRDNSRMWEYAAADSPDDYHMVAYCKECSYSTDGS